MSAEELELKVNEEYNNMSDPIGGVVIAMHPVYGPVFYQSIVKQVTYVYSPQTFGLPDETEVEEEVVVETVPPTIITSVGIIKPECHLCGYYTKGQKNYYKCNTSDCPANNKNIKNNKKSKK